MNEKLSRSQEPTTYETNEQRARAMAYAEKPFRDSNVDIRKSAISRLESNDGTFVLSTMNAYGAMVGSNIIQAEKASEVAAAEYDMLQKESQKRRHEEPKSYVENVEKAHVMAIAQDPFEEKAKGDDETANNIEETYGINNLHAAFHSRLAYDTRIAGDKAAEIAGREYDKDNRLAVSSSIAKRTLQFLGVTFE